VEGENSRFEGRTRKSFSANKYIESHESDFYSMAVSQNPLYMTPAAVDFSP
jgi:hypothetical protein